MAPLNLLQYGWTLTNGMLSIVWDSQANIQKVCDNVKFLTSKGCSCKGNCSTHRCKCSKEHKNCRTNCKCNACENPHNNGGNCRWDCNESTTMTTSHTGNDNIIENDISDTELSEPENNLVDENSDDETRELVNDINISENFSECSQVPTIEDTIRDVFGESDDSYDGDF